MFMHVERHLDAGEVLRQKFIFIDTTKAKYKIFECCDK